MDYDDRLLVLQAEFQSNADINVYGNPGDTPSWYVRMPHVLERRKGLGGREWYAMVTGEGGTIAKAVAMLYERLTDGKHQVCREVVGKRKPRAVTYDGEHFTWEGKRRY